MTEKLEGGEQQNLTNEIQRHEWGLKGAKNKVNKNEGSKIVM